MPLNIPSVILSLPLPWQIVCFRYCSFHPRKLFLHSRGLQQFLGYSNLPVSLSRSLKGPKLQLLLQKLLSVTWHLLIAREYLFHLQCLSIRRNAFKNSWNYLLGISQHQKMQNSPFCIVPYASVVCLTCFGRRISEILCLVMFLILWR